MIVPDYMNCLVGYRAWNLTPDGDLVSHNQNVEEPWPQKSKKIAICTQRRHGSEWDDDYDGGGTYLTTSAYVPPVSTVHQYARHSFEALLARRKKRRDLEQHYAPMSGCSCGIYAAKSNTSDHYLSYECECEVWGEVYLWGKVQEYTDGYRAEFAYPKSLSTSRSQEMANKLAERYGVSCWYVQREHALEAYDFVWSNNVVVPLSSASSSGYGVPWSSTGRVVSAMSTVTLQAPSTNFWQRAKDWLNKEVD